MLPRQPCSRCQRGADTNASSLSTASTASPSTDSYITPVCTQSEHCIFVPPAKLPRLAVVFPIYMSRSPTDNIQGRIVWTGSNLRHRTRRFENRSIGPQERPVVPACFALVAPTSHKAPPGSAPALPLPRQTPARIKPTENSRLATPRTRSHGSAKLHDPRSTSTTSARPPTGPLPSSPFGAR